MTKEEINGLFPPEYGGNAQISDLRHMLTSLNSSGEFEEKWTISPDPAGYGDGIAPTSPEIKALNLRNDDYGITNIYVVNADKNTNYTGSSIVVSSDEGLYDSQTFITHYGRSFYEPMLADRGSLLTDSSLFIGAYNSIDKQGVPSFISFIVGNDYYNQIEILKIDKDGINLLDDNKFTANGLKSTQQPSTNSGLIQVDIDTGEIYSTPKATDPGDIPAGTNDAAVNEAKINELLANLRDAGIIG